jgi:hypothetical protein
MATIRCPECDHLVKVPDDAGSSVRCSSCRYRIVLGESEAEEEEPRKKKQRKERASVDSRVYVHEACGGTTEISGDDFARVANPFTYVSQTYCAACGTFAGLSRFAWADTDENLRDFRRRMRRKAPLSLKLWAWLFGPLLAATVCGLIGFLCAPGQRVGGVLGGAVAGAAFFIAFLTPYMSQWFWGIDYRGKK